jgi:hypothetical protein
MKASDNIFPKVSLLVGSAPSTPASGNLAIYAKTGGGVFAKDDTGTETTLSGGSSGMANPMTAAGDIIIGGTAGAPSALAKATDGNVLTLVSGAPAWAAAPGGGGASAAEIAYRTRQNAVMDPDAIEGLKADTFSYTVASGVTKYILASWKTTVGGAGRTEVRNPVKPMAVRNTTVTGLASGAAAVILDPALVTYSDAVTTYFTRAKALDDLDTRTVQLIGASTSLPFLPGPYGAIITQATSFDLAWTVWRIGSYGLNLMDEISDAATQRIGQALRIPVSKQVAGFVENSPTSSGTAGPGTQSAASVSFVLLPSTWSAQPDPVSSSYTFRDDFMGSTLDAGVWTSAASVAGNIGIDPLYQWCKLFGSGSWNGNALYRTAGEARVEGRAMVIDVFMPKDATAGMGGVGWSNGGTIAGAYSVTNFAHCLNFGGSGTLTVYEGATNRGTVGSGWTAGFAYRVKITLHSGGSATYEIQGGPQYPRIGSSTWTNITPGTSASAASTMYPGAVAYSGHGYISDMRVF